MGRLTPTFRHSTIFHSLLVAGLILTLNSSNTSAAPNPYEEIFPCRTLQPALGGGFKANCTGRWKRLKKGQVVFDISFSTDRFGRRNTPGGMDQSRPDLAVFFGDSFTLGAGVNDDETVPHFFARISKSHLVYNYGGSGFGPQQMLTILSRNDLLSEVNQVKGRRLGIYQFLDFHVERAVGKPLVYNSYGKYFPYFYLNKEGELVHQGNFEKGRPFLSGLYSLINKIPFLENLLERFTNSPSESDVLLTARIIEESYKKFASVFQSADFVVVFYPGSNPSIDSQLAAHLRKAGIRYLDYSGLVDMNQPGARVGDGHPSARTHEKVAERLVQDLPKGAEHLLPPTS